MLTPYRVLGSQDEEERVFPGGTHSLVEDMDIDTIVTPSTE